MRCRSLAAVLVSLPLFVACASSDEVDGPSPFDDDFPVSDDNVNAGAPDNDSLPDDNKADAVYPPKFELPKNEQSPVKSQGSRGVCSIFATTALVEALYIKAGMPVAEADFSEQWLQWASKNLAGEWRNTEGSSSEANLSTIVQFGTVKEAVWPYESFKWSTANDPACTTGENLPTKCYTNGDPSQAVRDAQKFKLPRTRWINPNSMKAHLTTKKTGINLGFTFFYPSWNHRRSTLPISTDLWRQGVVTYPNAKDKQVSLENRAGHAINIVGWDDNLEFPMRDEAGNPVLDAQGNPRMEKGFWLFKNSWGTGSFGAAHPYGDGYGWISYRYMAEYGNAVTADVPSLQPAREVCDDADRRDEDGNGKANCDDSACSAHPACTGNGTPRTYSASPALAIIDNNATGISSSITVADTGILSDVKITVDITHTYRADLEVVLVHPEGTFSLIKGQGGSEDDLKQTFAVAGLTGKQLKGTWTLKVIDSAAQDTGSLNSWKIDAISR